MMLLETLIENTDIDEFLTMWDLSQTRQTCSFLKKWVEKRVQGPYTWVEKCRLCDPNAIWEINRKIASCYRPTEKKWSTVYWNKKLPSVVPDGFWNYFSRFIKAFVSMSNLQQWMAFEPFPLVVRPHIKKWEIGMRIEIFGNSVHNEEDDYPEELKDIDEFISVGITIHKPYQIHDSILGLNPMSVGWHSDDGMIYFDSLVVGRCERFGSGDRIDVIVEYSCGIVMFQKNRRVVHIHELSGDLLSNPLIFGVSCTTMNSLFFDIV